MKNRSTLLFFVLILAFITLSIQAGIYIYDQSTSNPEILWLIGWLTALSIINGYAKTKKPQDKLDLITSLSLLSFVILIITLLLKSHIPHQTILIILKGEWLVSLISTLTTLKLMKKP